MMSAIPPTFEELTATVKTLQDEIAANKVKLADYNVAQTEEEKQTEASFKTAMNDHKKSMKEATDDMDKVKEAFRIAAEEDDPEKKKEAMKKAMSEKDDYESKKATKKGEDTPKDDKQEAKTAARFTILENKTKLPLIAEILQATKIIDPNNFAKLEKELTAATLEAVEEKYESLKPYMAAVGLGKTNTTQTLMPSIIPFQASATIGEGEKAFEGDVDWAKVDTNKIRAMYQ